LVFLFPGWGGAVFFTPKNLNGQIHIVRETNKEKESHIVKTVYTPISFAIMTECAGAMLLNITIPPRDIIVIPNANELLTAKVVHSV
jgi:hypothetical protein